MLNTRKQTITHMNQHKQKRTNELATKARKKTYFVTMCFEESFVRWILLASVLLTVFFSFLFFLKVSYYFCVMKQWTSNFVPENRFSVLTGQWPLPVKFGLSMEISKQTPIWYASIKFKQSILFHLFFRFQIFDFAFTVIQLDMNHLNRSYGHRFIACN